MSLYERCRFIVVSEELAVSDWARDIDRQTERHLVYTTQFVFIIQFVFFVFWQIVAHFNDSSLSLYYYYYYYLYCQWLKHSVRSMFLF